MLVHTYKSLCEKKVCVYFTVTVQGVGISEMYLYAYEGHSGPGHGVCVLIGCSK